jgi:hypothetical protein
MNAPQALWRDYYAYTNIHGSPAIVADYAGDYIDALVLSGADFEEMRRKLHIFIAKNGWKDYMKDHGILGYNEYGNWVGTAEV